MKHKKSTKVKQIFLLLLLRFCQLTMHENDELLGNVKDASGRPTRAIFLRFSIEFYIFVRNWFLLNFWSSCRGFGMMIVMM